MINRKKKTNSCKEKLGDLAPKFAELNDDVLFGKVWILEEKLSLNAKETSLEIARRMKEEGASIKFISKVTGLTKEEVEKL